MTAPIVTVTPTIMSGTVVRWFTNLEAADRCEPVLSASRDQVMFHGTATADTVPAAWQADARRAHEALAVQRHCHVHPTPPEVTPAGSSRSSRHGWTGRR